MTSSTDQELLRSTVEGFVSSLKTLEENTRHPPPQTSVYPSPSSSFNTIQHCRAVTSLIKANSTKLSLLLIHGPYTPSVIVGILKDLINGPLPSLASTVELCPEMFCTKLMTEETRWMVGRVFAAVLRLVTWIDSDERSKETGKENIPPATAEIWRTCDKLVEVHQDGVVGLHVRKAEEYRELVKDALEELSEWAGEEEEDADEEDAAREGDSVEPVNGQVMDDLFGLQKHIPKGDPDGIRQRLDTAIRKLRLILIMYQALKKRRLKTLPSFPLEGKDVISESKEKIFMSLQELMDQLKKITHLTDDLAGAFYDLDTTKIDQGLQKCCDAALTAVDVVRTNWKGDVDEFTAWVCALSRWTSSRHVTDASRLQNSRRL